MENVSEKVNKEEVPVYKILKQIKEGMLQAKELSKEVRQECVEVLILEGYSASSIAQLLDRSEKTIKRDLDDIWRRNSKRPTPEIALQLIAELISKSKSKSEHLMRLARSNEGELQERINAEHLAWQIENETAQRLQSLGYLPQAPQKVVGDIYHHSEEETKTYLELNEELNSLETITKENGCLDEKTRAQINLLKKRIELAEIIEDVVDLTKNKTNEINKTEGDDKNEQ